MTVENGPETLVRVVGNVGRITLNRPKALNALTLGMVHDMTKALVGWMDTPAVKAVVVDGAGGRAFCAGGDIRVLYESGKDKDGHAEEFWREEYRLNQLIKRYPKPYVAMIDGIVMGGGVGISVHGSHRVGGDHTTFAMPETGIGFYPDVGGTYFLPRLPGSMGEWMGLTGARLKDGDAFAAGLATHFAPSDVHANVIAHLEKTELDEDGEVLEEILHKYEEEPSDTLIGDLRPAIDHHFSVGSVEEILASLDAAHEGWAAKQAEVIRKKSPTSLKLTLRAIREGREMTFEECLRRELALSVRCLDDNDFYEGVRAVILDKDNAPLWKPASLDAVTHEALARYFAPEGGPAIDFIITESD